jgi:hypothetical protein
MAALTLLHVSVWLDAFAPERGAFAHALEWASHLSIPLLAIAARGQRRETSRIQGDFAVEREGLEGEAEKLIEACVARCEQTGVPHDALMWQGPAEVGVRTFLHPGELCVFGKGLPSHLKRTLLCETLHSPETSALVCPTDWRPLSRILVLYQHTDPAPTYLDAVAALCRGFDTRPVVLAVARTDADARWRQRLAEGALAGRGLVADFDAISGSDIRSAVAWAAKWRRCSHVIVAKRHASGWWRWLRGDPLEQLVGLTDRLAFLAISDGIGESPEAAITTVPSEVTSGRA